MDSITQAALGGAIGEAFLGRKIGYKASILGAVVATIPDLDVVLLPLYSPLQRISVHRGYSHSILVGMAGAVLITLALRRFKWTQTIAMGRLLLFTWLTLFTHILLDAFTTYGTQLFLPFSNRRFGFDSITIVDPVYTLPLLIGLTLSLTLFRKKKLQRTVANTAGLVISSAYLLLTLSNKSMIEKTFEDSLQSHGINYEKFMTVPVSAANVRWYAVAQGAGVLYLADYSQIKRSEIVWEAFPVNDHLLDDLDPELVRTLKWAAKDHYTVAEMEGTIHFYNLQCDMQGIRRIGDSKAPTAWYYKITPLEDGAYKLGTGMHREE
jgi:inner membrane protein